MPLPLVRSLSSLSVAALFALAPAVAAPHRAHVAEVVVNGADGTILYSRSPDAARRPASLTKMMTLFMAFDALDDGRLRLGDELVISRRASRQPPSRLGIAAGGKISVKAALQAVAAVSANDVAVALAERLGGTEPGFARMMIRKARQLGLRDTRFANASGLTNPGNVTTARDMASLSVALLRLHPDRFVFFSKRTIRWRSRRLPNHNHLLGKVTGVDGIKTGYTADAGYNLAASAKRNGKRIVVVVLGERSAAARDVRVANLIEQGFTAPTMAVHKRYQIRR